MKRLTHLVLLSLSQVLCLADSPLTLETAIRLGMESHPKIREARARQQAAGARLDRAGRPENPDLIIRSENATRGEREILTGISQGIPLTRRLSAEKKVEKSAWDKAGMELEWMESTVRRQVHAAFAAALFADEAKEIASAHRQIAEKTLRIARARTTAGESTMEEVLLAEMDRLEAGMQERRFEAARKTAMAHLASAIGRPESSIGKLEGTLKEVFGVEEIKALAEEGALQVQLAEKDVETRVLRERLARLEQIPDVDLEVLYRQDRGSRKEGLDLGLTMSLPLFDRGRAKIREATADVSAAQARLEWQQNRTRLRQLEIGERLGASVATFHQLQEEILPRLEKLVSKAELRHQAGDVAFTEVLTFQTRLLVKRTSFMETLSDLMEVWRELAWD